ncbi:MAG: 16S rRNA (cytidine(1402)-2'-O)-methyltransferase [Thermoanaerobaculia bacterium]
MTGRLWLVATPIGNLDDLSPRALAAFAEADIVACEDTRRTGLLLHHVGLKKTMVSMHEHNERARLAQLLAALGQGQTVAVASDAGTPLLSDPGYVLTRAAIAAGHRVEAIPGASAPLTALLVSGLPPYPFTFAGFAPPRSGKRRTFFRKLADLPHTLIIFESPHRIVPSLDDAIAELGDRPAALARELTKLNEEVVRGPLSDLRSNFAERGRILGEFVLVIGGKGAKGFEATSGEALHASNSQLDGENDGDEGDGGDGDGEVSGSGEND